MAIHINNDIITNDDIQRVQDLREDGYWETKASDRDIEVLTALVDLCKLVDSAVAEAGVDARTCRVHHINKDQITVRVYWREYLTSKSANITTGLNDAYSAHVARFQGVKAYADDLRIRSYNR